jgi:hypothetical protein
MVVGWHYWIFFAMQLGTALVVFKQFFGGRIFIALGQTIFTNSLAPALEKFAPSVDAQFVINVGATKLRCTVPASEFRGVLMAYNQALMHTFVSFALRALNCLNG